MGYDGYIQWDIQCDTMRNTMEYNGDMMVIYNGIYNVIQWLNTMEMMVCNMVYMVYIFVTGFPLSYSFPV